MKVAMRKLATRECGEMRIQNRNWTWKKNIPENCLFYINQSHIWTVKNGGLAMYHHKFIIRQLTVAANQSVEIDQYVCIDNKVKLFTCMYDLQTGEFLGSRCEVAFIVLRGDERELFLSYGFETGKTSVLYSSSKQKLPNVFISTSFKNITVRLWMREKRKKIFQRCFIIFLLSRIERKI